MLDVLVLGPVTARADGRSLPLRGPKQGALLVRLVVARGHPLTPRQLIADLWEAAPPRDPGHALQARISRLRADLPQRIEFRDGGYRLDPATVRTDSARFESLHDRGVRHLAEHNVTEASDCLYEALRLWRGPALAGLPDIPALKAESVRLERLRVTTLADRVDADLALDRGAEIIPELHALIDHDPLVARSWGQLMTALYCAGRAEEALGAFARARALLADHLGVEPSGFLRKLHVAILRGDPPRSLLPRPAGSSEARHRAHLLALELGGPVDEDATLDVAEYALGASDERLALRAAMAVVAESPDSVHGHRVAGLAASSLGLAEVADAHFETARRNAATDAEQTAVALSTARHLGLQHDDAAGALAVVQDALRAVDDPDETAHLNRAHVRWATIAERRHGSEPPHDRSPPAQHLPQARHLLPPAVAGPVTAVTRACACPQPTPINPTAT